MESRCLVTNFGPNYVDIIPPDSNKLKKITIKQIQMKRLTQH